MTESDICGNCGQRNSCKQVYQHIADYKGPSVLAKVLTALVLPLLGFVLALLLFERFISTSPSGLILGLILALGAAAAVAAAAKVLNRRFGEHRQN